MRIDSGVIGMESARRYTSSETRKSRVSIMDYEGATSEGLQGNFGGLLSMGGDREELAETSEEEKNAQGAENGENLKFISLEDVQARMVRVTHKSVSLRSQSDTVENFKQLSLRYIFNLLFGADKTKELFEGTASEAVNTGSSTGEETYLVYHNRIEYYESENTSFKASGTVKTADGREIDFNVDVAMSREFSAYYEESSFQLLAPKTCDPLVINLEGDIASLSDQKFFFDIDADGDKDEISMLESGSGYLALDKNGDGVINDGKELFGPQSGNGFKDLAAYDEDKNGWIDEADDIWSKLKIWCKDENGEDKLYTLAESGVGAICLQNASTDFTLGNSAEANGYIRSTGIFLYENGNVGTLQHLDLAQ